MVRSIEEKKKDLSQSILNILQTISTYENIPRKKAKFLNFMKNSFRYMKQDDLESAWTLLEEAMKESREQQQPPTPATNGTKRKLDEEAPKHEDEKKLKLEESEETELDKSNKFSWSTSMKEILLSKQNEIDIKKLKKKVLKRYKKFGGEISDNIENKFIKKLKKLKGIVLDNDKVRLIE